MHDVGTEPCQGHHAVMLRHFQDRLFFLPVIEYNPSCLSTAFQTHHARTTDTAALTAFTTIDSTSATITVSDMSTSDMESLYLADFVVIMC